MSACSNDFTYLCLQRYVDHLGDCVAHENEEDRAVAVRPAMQQIHRLLATLSSVNIGLIWAWHQCPDLSDPVKGCQPGLNGGKGGWDHSESEASRKAGIQRVVVSPASRLQE